MYGILTAALQTISFDLQRDYFNDTDKYQIRIVYMPLFCKQVGHITGPLNITHAGLAFINMDSDAKLVVEYQNVPGMSADLVDYLVPDVSYNEDTGLYSFQWRTDIAVQVNDELKTGACGWYRQNIVASAVPGNILNRWLHEYAQRFQDTYADVYQFIGFRYRDTREPLSEAHSSQCHDFTFWGLQSLQNDYGVAIQPVVVQRLYAFYYLDRKLDAPVVLSAWDTDTAQNHQVAEFYLKYKQALRSVSSEELFTGEYSGLKFSKKEFMNFVQNKYWSFQTDSTPYFWFDATEVLAPGSD